jgi:hypothetical protein
MNTGNRFEEIDGAEGGAGDVVKEAISGKKAIQSVDVDDIAAAVFGDGPERAREAAVAARRLADGAKTDLIEPEPGITSHSNQ